VNFGLLLRNLLRKDGISCYNVAGPS